jgi:signal transduction histidine kinase
MEDNGAVWAVGDPGSVAQIVRILLDNALVHGASGQPVHVHAEIDDGMARVVVEDGGPGIARDERDRVFERFERGADASEGGFGLGLAIGRELARRMDGDLTLEGDPPGARFVLSLAGAPSP